MARICNAQSAKNGSKPGSSGWLGRPAWNAIVFFDEWPNQPPTVTGHIDLYNGATKLALHAKDWYKDAAVVWFWKLGP